MTTTKKANRTPLNRVDAVKGVAPKKTEEELPALRQKNAVDFECFKAATSFAINWAGKAPTWKY